MEQSPLGPKAQEAIRSRERIVFGLCFEWKAQWVINHEMRKTGSSQVLRKRWVTQEISSLGKGKVPIYLRYGARVIHMWFSGDSWNHGKVLKHARRLKIFTSALMRGLLPHLCRIKYKWDGLNSANNPQKSKF